MRWVVRVLLGPANLYLGTSPAWGGVIKWTDDIYKARFYKTKKAAKRDGQRVVDKYYRRKLIVDFEIIKIELIEHGKEL